VFSKSLRSKLRLIAALAGLLFTAACAPSVPAPSGSGSRANAEPSAPPAGRVEPTQLPTPGEPAVIRTIRLGVPSASMNFMHPVMANAAGIAREHSLDFEVQPSSRGASLTVAAMVAEQLDFAFAFESMVNAAVQGAPVRGIMVVQQAAPYVLVAPPEIAGVADLRGKVVGQSGPASASTSVIRQVLARGGVPAGSYTALALGEDPERLAALQTGHIQATVFSPPFHRKATELGMRVIASAADYDVVSPNGLGTSIAVLGSRRDDARAVIRAFFRTTDWMRAHRDDVLGYLVQQYDIDREAAEESYELLMASWSATGLLTAQQIDSTASRWREISNLPADADITSAVDFSLVEEVRGSRAQ
jgi:ABC-type nitrate/sulfonate/bicarbonate transport system substrate-binding protein